MSTLKYRFYLSYLWEYLALMDYEYLVDLARLERVFVWAPGSLAERVVNLAKITPAMVDLGINQVPVGEMLHYVDSQSA